MRKVWVAVAAAARPTAVTAGPADALVRHSCGNYGDPEGYKGDDPVFTREPIVGAGVEEIRTRVIGCRKGSAW
jgi:hypothetical protein